jgi:hypothetical protein
MFDALIARTADALSQLNTLAIPVVRIRFQICPGVDAGIGIAAAPYTVSAGGAQFKSDVTDANGEVTVPILLITMGGVVLRIFDTDYPLSFHVLRAVNTIPGQQKRLDVLGYITGYLLNPLGNRPIDDGNDSGRFQQAINNFQTDQTIAIDGDIGPQTRGRLTSVAGD